MFTLNDFFPLILVGLGLVGYLAEWLFVLVTCMLSEAPIALILIGGLCRRHFDVN